LKIIINLYLINKNLIVFFSGTWKVYTSWVPACETGGNYIFYRERFYNLFNKILGFV
jgi:hypothetical protein